MRMTESYRFTLITKCPFCGGDVRHSANHTEDGSESLVCANVYNPKNRCGYAIRVISTSRGIWRGSERDRHNKGD